MSFSHTKLISKVVETSKLVKTAQCGSLVGQLIRRTIHQSAGSRRHRAQPSHAAIPSKQITKI